jgi:hypothetical protein
VPRPGYDPAVTTVLQRDKAKAAELGIGVRTVQEYRARYARQGLLGLVDGRVLRGRSVTGRCDARLVAAVREALDGHYYRAPSGEVAPAVVGDEFDLVVSLCHRGGHGPAAGVADHVREVPDAALTSGQLSDICELAEITAAAVRDGQKVLVRCHSGFNRSGLVVVQALGHLGYDVDDAIFLVRYRRSKWALNNNIFVDYLTTGLDVARLLADLGD